MTVKPHPALHAALRETRNQGTNLTPIIKYDCPESDLKYSWALYYVFLQTGGQPYELCERNETMRPVTVEVVPLRCYP